jgi:squalene-hopene/tetraprenyl-beta-curcumene cyclase
VRRLLLITCIACTSSSPPSRTAGIDQALARGGAFLAGHQFPDGSFRSTAYSALRDGYSLTPLAALALRVTAEAAAYAKAVEFTATLVDDRGNVRPADELSYPLHSYAIGALVLGAPENVERYRGKRDALLAAIRARQMTEALGWHRDDASYGGWGYAPGIPTRPAGAIENDQLTANISSTVIAVGALVLAGTRTDDPALVAARSFLARCQNADGGFFFSPALPDANKAGPDGHGGFSSYGSTTADGLRMQLRLGADAAKATAWITRSFDAARNPGEFTRINEIRRLSAYYYWVWSAAHALEHTRRDDPRWAETLGAQLVALENLDGSWTNPATEMREDDPFVATPFAIAGLALSRGVITGERPSHAAWR